ncbi:MAG: hypothetical protein D6719_04890 [Candidatus Dadabacteria bacterium]|nr:MAG: hypothetical protein D6719_04890 [Candidatus Dadabacteria bacterium]
MFEKGDKTVRELRRVLKEEISLYSQYVALIRKERSLVRKFKHKEINASASERNALCDKMAELQKKRISLMKKFPDWQQHQRLSKLIALYCHPEDRAELLNLTEKLRNVATEMRVESLKTSQLVNFAMKMVSGTISILWSATQSVVRSYSRRGAVKESYHPTRSRLQNLLKEV